MNIKRVNLILILILAVLITFIVFDSVNYKTFKGGLGSGYSVGFVLTEGAIVSVSLILLIAVGYWPLRKLLYKNKNSH